LVTKSYAPRRIARTAVSMLPNAVMAMTVTRGSKRRVHSMSSSPSTPSMHTSVTRRSGAEASIERMAARASCTAVA
jgi:hypothetical protein